MAKTSTNQQIITQNNLDDPLTFWVEKFLVDRKAQNLAVGTVRNYREKLTHFSKYCDDQVITRIFELSPDILRRYLLYLEDTGHNPGGVHGFYRVLKTFFIWFENEAEPDGWKNPIRKVKAPKNPIGAIEPVSLATVKTLVGTCPKNFHGVRDAALFWFLLDTGARASEVLAVDIADLDQISGAVFIRKGKGRKPRTVYLGQRARRAVRAYLKQRNDKAPALWVTDQGERLFYSGLREIIRRRSVKAGVKRPALHDFRRAFALQCLRNGMDIYSLQALMGHADLQVLRRYLKQTDQDLQAAHRKSSPVDNIEGGDT